MSVPFSKYQGLGNDFLVIDLRDSPAADAVQTPAAARALCDRRFGVGGDGVLAILPSRSADLRMRVLNADGSEAEMCGNGIRCVARHLYERDPVLGGRPVIHVETLAGVLPCGIGSGPEGIQVSVQMGRPRLRPAEIPMRPAPGLPDDAFVDRPFEGMQATAVSMGNPHLVFFVAEQGAALRALAEKLGPGFERHESMPNRTNVELARAHDQGIELVVWERGCGITLACGTGACATAVAAVLTGRAEAGRDIRVRLLGGELAIQVAPGLSQVTMRGPATFVFDSAVELEPLVSSASARG